MNTYEEMYSALLKLCKNEGLQLIETEMNEDIIYLRLKDKVVVNKSVLYEE